MATLESVKIWINAFIPREIAEYTKVVPGHLDKTMIPGPMPWSDCFYTDQRSFSNDIRASARMHSEARIEVRPMGSAFRLSRMTQYHRINETVECDCEDGEDECRKTGDKSYMTFVLMHPHSQDLTEFASLDIFAMANNPCSPSSKWFGKIDFRGTFDINLRLRTVEFRGYVDQFPAFEAYVTANDGEGRPLFREPPPPKNTVMNLPGRANRPIVAAGAF